MPITVFTGKNSYIIQQELQQLVQDFVEQYGSNEIVRLDGAEVSVDQLSGALFEQGLFSEKSLVVLREISANKRLQEQLEDLFNRIPDDTHLVIVDQGLDKRTSFFKKLRASAQLNDFPEPDEYTLAQWVQSEVKQRGGDIGRAEASFLVARVGLDQWQLSHEIDKLINEKQPVQKADIETVVEERMRETIFNLLDLAFAKETDKTIRTYRSLLLHRTDPHYILSMIGWQLHVLLIVAHAANMPAEQIAKRTKLSPFVIRKAQSTLRTTKKHELVVTSELIVEADYQTKTGAITDAEALVEQVLVAIAK